MKLVVLGSGVAVPSVERGPSGFLVETEQAQILVDGGSGTLRALVQSGVEPRALDGGVYTHRHIDHTGDLASLLFSMRAGGRLPTSRDYPIWAGEGFADFLERLHGCYPGWLQGNGWKPRVHELPLDGVESVVLPGEILLESAPANHSAGALHIRLSHGERSIVFSGDTGPSDALVTLARDADVLVCECALSRPRDGIRHLWPEAVADLVREAQPKRTLLTHFYEEVDPKRALSVIQNAAECVERAWDGMTIDPV